MGFPKLNHEVLRDRIEELERNNFDRVMIIMALLRAAKVGLLFSDHYAEANDGKMTQEFWEDRAKIVDAIRLAAREEWTDEVEIVDICDGREIRYKAKRRCLLGHASCLPKPFTFPHGTVGHMRPACWAVEDVEVAVQAAKEAGGYHGGVCLKCGRCLSRTRVSQDQEKFDETAGYGSCSCGK